MTIQELIEQLQDYPSDMEVKIYMETFDGCFEQDIDYTDIFKGENYVTIKGQGE